MELVEYLGFGFAASLDERFLLFFQHFFAVGQLVGLVVADYFVRVDSWVCVCS